MADGHARGLDDEALRRLCLALAPLLAAEIDLRSSGCEPRVPGETAARETPVERDGWELTCIDWGVLYVHPRHVLDAESLEVAQLWLAWRGQELPCGPK